MSKPTSSNTRPDAWAVALLVISTAVAVAAFALASTAFMTF